MVVVILDDDEVLFCNDQVFAVNLTENIGLEHVAWWASAEEPGLEEDQPIHARADHINVVGDQEHRQPELVM